MSRRPRDGPILSAKEAVLTVAANARIAALALLAASAASGYTFERKYIHSEVDEYEILVEPVNFDGELVAVTQHRTVIQNGVGHEEIRFIRASETNAGDLSSRFAGARLTLSLDASAQAFSSWSSTDVVVTQIVDALQMFYIAHHPGTGASRVQSPGQSYSSPELFEEDWSQRPNSLGGRRRFAIQVKMTGDDEEKASYRIEFSPPVEPALAPPRPWMTEPACRDAANSFYAIVAKTQGVRVSWGCEQTTSIVRNREENGKDPARGDGDSRQLPRARSATTKALPIVAQRAAVPMHSTCICCCGAPIPPFR